ncbi:MAG: phenylalanine--tRNA ligase beta subunit-related protein [Minisyncoccia bacterium]
MKVSYNWLNEYLNGKAPTPEKVGDFLTMHSMEIESMEKVGNDTVMDAKTTPNLNHSCLCHRGIAREVGVIADIKVNQYSREFKDFQVSETEKKLEIKIADGKKCRRYIGRVIENIKAGESPKWLQEKLEAIGQRSINNIVDATNFVMNEIGQPMHAFDADKLADEKNVILIEVKNCKNGDWITTLDKKEVELDESVLTITSKEIPLAIAGIKGGMYAELEERTKNIVLESASFDPVLIRKTAQKLKIQTDASKRYENDYSSEMADEAMDILTKLIVEIAGTKDTKVGESVDVYPRRANKYKLGISAEEASQIIGVKIINKDIENIFDRFGFEFKLVKPVDEVLKFAKSFIGVPYKLGASISYDAPKVFDCSGFISYCFALSGIQIPRMSVDQHVFGKIVNEKEISPGDIVFSNTGEGKIHYKTIEFLPGEEVKEGVDHCGIYLGNGEVIHCTNPNGVIIEKIKDNKKFKKIVAYRRMTENEERFVITVPDERLDLRIKEDLAEEIGRIYGYDKIGEVSTKFEGMAKMDKGFYYKEKIRRILYAQGFSEIINYTFTDKGEIELENSISPEKRFLRSNLTDGIKNSLEFNVRYSELVGMKQIKIFEFGHIFTNKGEYKRFVIGVKNPLGLKKPKEQDVLNTAVAMIEKKLGLVAGQGLSLALEGESLDTNNIAEYDFEEIIKNLSEPKEYDFSEIGDKTKRFKKISSYPFMIRDVAVFTPESTKAEDVFEIINNEINKIGAGDLLVKNYLFDVFTKKFEDGSSKTSFAYRLVFQSMEKTLSDDEINIVMTKITEKLNANKGWQVR